jgi:hypothetical protein
MRARRTRLLWAAGVGVVAVSAVVATAIATSGNFKVSGHLNGYEETPAVSTAGNGSFVADITDGGSAIKYKLTYSGLEGNVTQAHIHFGQKSVAGGISTFLCSNLGNGPAGTQACPPAPATVTGTIHAADIIGPTAQGIGPGQLDELVRAIRSGVAYANVHSTTWPGGEIRAQLRRGKGHR